jgi:MFS family permease
LISTNVLQIIFVRVLEGAAWALFWPTIEALSTEIGSPMGKGRSMGMISVSYGIAFATASLVAGSMTGTFGYSRTFATYLALSLGAIALAALVIPRPKHRNHPRIATEEKRKLNLRSLRSRAVTLTYFLGGSYTFGLGAILTLFSVFAKFQGVAVFLIGLLFGVFWVGRIIGSFAGGHLSDRFGRGPVAILAMVGSSFGLLLIAFSTGAQTLFFSAIILGFSIGAIFPVTVAIISENVPQSVRGVAMGIYETSCALGFLSAAAIGGLLSDLYSPRAPYLVAATISLASAIIFGLKRPK